jgi:hypothetical protein
VGWLEGIERIEIGFEEGVCRVGEKERFYITEKVLTEQVSAGCCYVRIGVEYAIRSTHLIRQVCRG